MFERSDLETLAAFRGEHPVVSLYLNLPPRLRGTDAFRTRLKGLLKEAADRAPKEDITTIEEYFDKQFDWVGRGAVVFCGQGDDLWQAESFAVPVRSTIHVGDRPFIMPLANLLDTYGSYAVALVDQQTIRMIYIHLGEVVASKKLEGEEVKRLKAAGGSAGRSRGDDVSGRSAETARGNLRGFADALASFCAHYDAEHILLGGAEQTLHQFKEMLTQPWQDRVEGMFAASIRMPENEILVQSLELMDKRAQALETRLAEQVRTLAAKGANGVVGAEDTFAAIEEGRVQTLVLVENALPPQDADRAITRVVDYGGDVVFVSQDSPLADQEIGALLRY